jgi:DnaJ-class molecular chaperone
VPTKKDYYEILGVGRDVGEKAIKAAYRRLARRYHPDVNKDDKTAEAKFKEVAEAFAVLSDAEKKAKYDRGGHEAFGAGFDPFAGFDPQRFDFGYGARGMEDLLGQLFGANAAAGRGARVRRVERGQDLRFETRIGLMDAARGATIELVVPRMAAAGGRERVRREEKVKVRIPAGVNDGATLRIAGKGDAGLLGGPPGDLLLLIGIEPHERFRRDGLNLSCDVPVGIARATLGGSVEVPTLNGPSTIKLPPGTRSGQQFRLRGKGMPNSAGRPTGDLFAVIQIHPPSSLDGRSRELMEEFQRLNPDGSS